VADVVLGTRHKNRPSSQQSTGDRRERATSPERIATAIAEEIGREVNYRDVETDGAAREAQQIRS
jgi:hypothetical protein